MADLCSNRNGQTWLTPRGAAIFMFYDIQATIIEPGAWRHWGCQSGVKTRAANKPKF